MFFKYKTKEKMVSIQKTDRKIVFRSHLPEGARACQACCSSQMGLEVMPGYFRDFDVDFDIGSFGTCSSCGGTGVDIGLSNTQREELHNLRFRRYELDLHLANLRREIAFGESLTKDKNISKAVEPILASLKHEADEIVAELKMSLLTEEKKLLLLVQYYWQLAGKPRGCYAEQIVETLRRHLTGEDKKQN